MSKILSKRKISFLSRVVQDLSTNQISRTETQALFLLTPNQSIELDTTQKSYALAANSMYGFIESETSIDRQVRSSPLMP